MTAAWNNDLFQKQACLTEQKMMDPSLTKKNLEAWHEMQRKKMYTPDTEAGYDGLSYPSSARSTGTRTAKRISRSKKLRAAIAEEMHDDLMALKSQSSAAVTARKQTNEKLKKLVGMVDEMTAADKTISAQRFDRGTGSFSRAEGLHPRH